VEAVAVAAVEPAWVWAPVEAVAAVVVAVEAVAEDLA